jgi:hypothetical protein
MTAVITEGLPRGFLSNYTTILITLRELVGRRGYNGDDIFISPEMFSLYGNPINWFLESKVDHPEDAEIFGSTQFIDIDPWPTEEQLNLSQYIKYFPYNSRINSLLESSLVKFDNCLGIHYRGTDHKKHVDRVSLETFFSEISEEIERNEYESVFLATDEANILEPFEDFFDGVEIYHNHTTKSKTSQSLHWTGFDSVTRIKLGDEVLLDSHSIANCKTVICKTSNIINYARILNPDLNVIYLDKNLEFRK